MVLTYRYQGHELELFAAALKWKTYFRSVLRPYIKGNVLEVGAGNGSTTLELIKVPHLSWTCVEPDPDLCNALTRTLHEAGLQDHSRVINGTVQNLSEEMRFDSILYVDVLEHIQDDAEELTRATIFLEPGGALTVLATAHQWLFSEFDLAIGHYRRYNKKALRQIAPQGLSEERLIYLDSVGMLASLANKVILHRETPSTTNIRTWDHHLIPISRVLDPILRHRIGKTVVGIWKRPSD